MVSLVYFFCLVKHQKYLIKFGNQIKHSGKVGNIIYIYSDIVNESSLTFQSRKPYRIILYIYYVFATVVDFCQMSREFRPIHDLKLQKDLGLFDDN